MKKSKSEVNEQLAPIIIAGITISPSLLIAVGVILLFFIAFRDLPIYVKGIAFCLFSFCFGKLFTIYKKKYGEEVPVILINGKPHDFFRVDPERFAAAMQKESRRHQ